MNNIRNFCIIAHIDHGKSTLADRFLELTHTVEKRDMKAQLLDSMDLERERGITIKLHPLNMEYAVEFPNSKHQIPNKSQIPSTKFQKYNLNLIDTPGHVDFSYEVSRSLAAVEGAVLLVDASQGVEAQTLSNLYAAIDQNLVIIPVVNKIDLPNAQVDVVRQELVKLLGVSEDEILLASGKTGVGVPEILQAVIERVPAPSGNPSGEAQGLIFDSKYDDYRGVVVYVRIMNGAVKKGDLIHLIGSGKDTHAIEVGAFKPHLSPRDELAVGSIGYIVTGFKDVSQARVGDTVTLAKKKAAALPGYKEVKPMVYAGIFPETGEEYPKLRDAVSEIKLTDASLAFESEHSPALGFGYRCGFLGMLHMEIISERLRREHGLSLVVTTPSVAYEIILNSPSSRSLVQPPPQPSPSKGEGVPESAAHSSKGEEAVTIHSPLELPDASNIREIREPWVRAEIVTPKSHLGPLMALVGNKHGIFKNTEYLDEERAVLHFEAPLSGIITDFYDTLKSASSGYASMNYEFLEFRPADIVRLDILIAEEISEAFSMLVVRQDAYETGKRIVEKLKELIPKQQFVIKLQAAIGSKIIAAERIAALRKDVTKGLYGGDVTRKRKLLEKQKKGKKKMMQQGKVEIPSRAFLEVLKR